LLKNVNLAEGTVIHTAYQKAGRGQRGNSWNSDPLSNLVASVVLRPTFLSLNKQFFLYQVFALATHDTMSELLHSGQFDIQIKWPNDILVNEKKIAGILIENNILNDNINWSVAGLGINVNQEHFPGLENVTSLKLLTGENFSTREILRRFCKYLEKYYLQMKSNRYEDIQKAYLSHLFGLSRKMTFKMNETERILLVKGISGTGLLHLEDEFGCEIEADVKQLKWIY
jgi:BirA family transcriptional regulator, biotin operon repressor / biotin---[acetyl-CoA-carboxylase] ligase